MKTIKVVAAIIVRDGMIFATQRGYGDYKDWWEFPGGKIEPGETPEEALKREIREELDTEIAIEDFLTTVEYTYPDFHLSMDCFICSVVSGELKLLEHEAAKWLPADDLWQVNWLPSDVEVLEAIERAYKYKKANMDLKQFDNKCVRIITVWGEAFEGVASYSGREYVLHEYGHDEEALCITPVLFYADEISDVKSLEDVSGPFGHYSEKYGLLEIKCLGWGTDLIEEIFDSDDDVQIIRMLDCMSDHVQSLAERAIPGDAPWRSGAMPEPEDENGQGPVYLGELEKMLRLLIQYNQNDEVVQKSKDLLERLARR